MQHFVVVGGCITFGYSLPIDYLLEEVAAISILHYEEQLLRLFDDLVELNDKFMLNELEDLDLSTDALDICLLTYQLLLEYLYSDLLTRW